MRGKMYAAAAICLALLLGGYPCAGEGAEEMSESTTMTATAPDAMTTVPASETATTTMPETFPPAETSGRLNIDSEKCYEGMKKSYKDGYVPTVKDGCAEIILPLIGETREDEVVLTADLGSTANSPFVYGNYTQTVKEEEGVYLFALKIPLNRDRINGTYPVVLTAAYTDRQGNLAEQPFTVYVTIQDGRSGETTTAPAYNGPETVRRPELFIASCQITPQIVQANETFMVKLTVENIGTLQAKNVKLAYSCASGMLIPTEQNNIQLLGNLARGEEVESSFAMSVSRDAVAGLQNFEVIVSCGDAYGGDYSLARSFAVQVNRPPEVNYDKPALEKSVIAGTTLTLPANVFNTGKSILRNVTVALEGNGFFPSSSVFLGDILPGEAGYGQMNVFVGMMSDPEGNGYYGNAQAEYTITYTDDMGQENTIAQTLKTQIREPVPEPTPTPDPEQTQKTQAAGQWWFSVLAALAILTIIISWIVTTRVIRALKTGKHSG